MPDALAPFGGGLLTVALTVGPVAALVGLLNRRDRRVRALRGVVLAQVNARELRGLFAIQIRCGLFSRRSVVTLDFSGESREQLWEVVGRLSRSLPPHARLVARGPVDPQVTATLTVETASRPRLGRASPAAASS